MSRTTTPGEADARLSALGLVLPAAPQPVANYVPALIAGNLLFISGQISKDAGGDVMTGVLGHSATLEHGQKAAHWCALNIIAQAKAALGTLDRVQQVVRLNGFVASSADFTDHPRVVNGASDLMVAVFGDRGRHTRAAIGVAALPLGASVEIDAVLLVG